MRSYHRAAIGLLVAALPSAVPPTPTRAQDVEEILSYDVRVDVRADSRLDVTERITVRALGREIRRGIYRDFPTSFPRASGFGRIEAPFGVVRVTRDGVAEPYEVSTVGGPRGRGGVRIRIGDPDVFLDPGVYTYSISYETWRWVVFGEAEDQLYWNVTGNGWSFPIRSASTTVRVDGLNAEPRIESWTGPEGSTDNHAVASWDPESGEVSFATTRPLGAGHGLTVRVSFPTGVVSPPPESLRSEWFRLDWGGWIDTGYVVLLVIAVYLLMWRRVGIDPPRGPTVVRYEPPAGFSPTALGYLERRGYEPRHFTAAIVSLAVKGAVLLEKTKSKWVVHRIDGGVELAPEEKQVFVELLGSREKLEIAQSHHARLSAAIRAMRRALSRGLEKEYFVNNRRWFAAGVLVSLAALAALAWRWRFRVEPAAFFLTLWLSFWTLGVTTLLYRALSDVSVGLRGAGWGHTASGLMLLVFSIPFVAGEVFVGVMLFGMVPTHLLAAPLLVGATNVLFYHLLERPTLRGRGVLDELDGFRRFLGATEEDRLDRLHPPDATPELFERYLPHAIALGLDVEWAKRFEWVLDPKGEMGSPHTFAWFDGGTVAMDATSFTSALGGSFTSTLSASSMAPGGSGGGGGGGGSSGGGGGGGGGGGW